MPQVIFFLRNFCVKSCFINYSCRHHLFSGKVELVDAGREYASTCSLARNMNRSKSIKSQKFSGFLWKSSAFSLRTWLRKICRSQTLSVWCRKPLIRTSSKGLLRYVLKYNFTCYFSSQYFFFSRCYNGWTL